MTPDLVLAIDQGTTSSRAILFDADGGVVSVAQKEHRQIMERPGWVEHDPIEIRDNVAEVVAQVLDDVDPARVAAVGVTNQRETAVVWDKATGEPIYNAIVWQDTRTDELIRELAGEEGRDKYRERCGLHLATYFSGPKFTWILDAVEGSRERDLAVGTIDSWIIWNLTGGVHVTDVTNASRTMLMDIRTLQWCEDVCAEMRIPMGFLPEIRSSSEVYGEGTGVLAEIPIAGAIGDQQAATLGQACLEPGQAKNTYGTGCFMLLNTGTEPVESTKGLLTTVAQKLGNAPTVYALEGSVAVTGSLIQWLRDNLGIISSSSEVEELAASVDDNGGVYFVPAFSGLFAPYWRDDARGVIAGLTRYNTKAHIARAALEASAFQTAEVVEAMAGAEPLTELRVDGGMVANDLLMQFQADILGVDVVAPVVTETTALGAAFAAGLAVDFWKDQDEIAKIWKEGKRWSPKMDAEERERLLATWKKAVTRTFDWL